MSGCGLYTLLQLNSATKFFKLNLLAKQHTAEPQRPLCCDHLTARRCAAASPGAQRQAPPRTRRKHPTRNASSDANPPSGPHAANCCGSASTLAARAHARRARRPRLDPRTSLKRGSNTRKILPRQRVGHSLPLGFALTAHTRCPCISRILQVDSRP